MSLFPEGNSLSRYGKRRARLVIHLTVLLAYLLLTLLMTWPLVGNFTTAIPGDSYDGWQNYWNLWWIKIALVERLQNPFVTDLLYHPTGVGLYFHTLNPFNGIVTLPIQLPFGLIPAYNAVVLISWSLGGYGAFLLALWVARGRLESGDWELEGGEWRAVGAALVGGLIFTFSPFHMAHLLGHMQVMALQWLPFYILHLLIALDRQARGRPWRRSALMAGLYLSLAALCDWYFVLYLFFFTVMAVVWHGLAGFTVAPKPAPAVRFHPLERLLAPLWPATVAGALFLLLLSPVLLPMLREATQFSFMVRPASDLYIFSASLTDFLAPNRLHPLFLPDSLTWVGNQVAPPSEHTVGIGYLPLVLTLIAGWRERRRAAFWVGCALFFLLLALGPRLHLGNITRADIPNGASASDQWTPYVLLNRLVPFMRISRSVSRYAVMVQLSVAVAAGLGLACLFQHRNSSKDRFSVHLRAYLPWIAGIIILGEFWVAPYPISPPDTPAYYEQLRNSPTTGAVLNLPMNYDRPGYLLYQTVHQRPLTVGYISRDDPRTLTERVPVLQHFRHLGADILSDEPTTIGATVLHDLGVSLVVLDRYKMPGGEERDYTEQLAAAIFAGQPPLYADDRLRVFVVTQPASPQPYLALDALNWGPAQKDHRGVVQGRLVGAAPARLAVRHAPTHASLAIRYQSVAGARLQVRSDKQLLTTLPPSQTSTSAVIPIDGLTELTLLADRGDGVLIQALSLHTN